MIIAQKEVEHKNFPRGATRGLPTKTTILVLYLPKHAYLQSSYETRCINTGMIAPIKCCTINDYMYAFLQT
ncbi:hypothetical protein CR513_54878, partial [Mucuna pruriens]